MPISTKNPLDYGNLDLDDREARHAFYDAWIAVGAAKTGERMLQLKAMGIIDENGDRIATHTPPDMLDPNSSVEQ